MNKVTDLISIADAHIMFRNFMGKESKFNAKGRRNFCVQLEDELAHKLEDDGWNIKWREPRNEGDDPMAYMQVSVSFDNIPPNIWAITSHNKTRLNSETVEILDWADISNVDLIIRPYNWEVNGKTGVKGYVKDMYVTLVENAFDEKYADIPDSRSQESTDCDEG